MGKAAAKKDVTTTADNDGLTQIIDEASMQAARSRLLSNLLGMGWRLAIAIVVPIIIGVKLDARFGTKPSYALSGFMLAVGLASYMIYNAYQDIQKELQEEENASQGAKEKDSE